MAIKYKYVEYNNPLTTEKQNQRVRPVTVITKYADNHDLVRRITTNNYYAKPDAAKAVEAVFCALEQLLADGCSININGFGTFIPTLRFVKENISNNDPEKKEKSTARRAENIEVKSIIFRANKYLKIRLSSHNIEKKEQPLLLEQK